MSLTLADVDRIAAEAHAGQVDKIGVPYVEHVRAVAAGLAPFGVGLQMAGLLHDSVEDTDLTFGDLAELGVPWSVVDIVQRVTKRPGVPYEDMIGAIVGDYAACLVKLADNAHNSLPERAAQLPEEKRERLARKYADARRRLWQAVPFEDVQAIVERVNASLLPELIEFRAAAGEG